MITDQDRNEIKDGDWIAFHPKDMVRGQVMFVNDSGLSMADNSPMPKFCNIMIQIACQPNTSTLQGVSKIYGPQQPKDSLGE